MFLMTFRYKFVSGIARNLVCVCVYGEWYHQICSENKQSLKMRAKILCNPNCTVHFLCKQSVCEALCCGNFAISK